MEGLHLCPFQMIEQSVGSCREPQRTEQEAHFGAGRFEESGQSSGLFVFGLEAEEVMTVVALLAPLAWISDEQARL